MIMGLDVGEWHGDGRVRADPARVRPMPLAASPAFRPNDDQAADARGRGARAGLRGYSVCGRMALAVARHGRLGSEKSG